VSRLAGALRHAPEKISNRYEEQIAKFEGITNVQLKTEVVRESAEAHR